MKIVTTLFIAMLMFVAGCASTPAQDAGSVIKTNTDGSKIENLSDYAAYAKVVGDPKPMFELTCPAQGCVIASLKVNSPQDKNAIAAPSVPENVSVAIAKGFFGLAHDVVGLGPWYFGSKVLTTAFSKANSSITNTNIDNSNRSTDSSNRSITNTSTSTTNTTTNTTTTNTTNSNNRTCTSGTGGNGGGTTTGGAGGTTGSPSC